MTLTRTVTGLSCAIVLATASVVSSSGAALAAAPSNGCPAGYELMSVADLSSKGYHVPSLVDSPLSGVLSFGQPGNGDQYVCAVQLGRQLTSFGLPIDNFIDNQLPAS